MLTFLSGYNKPQLPHYKFYVSIVYVHNSEPSPYSLVKASYGHTLCIVFGCVVLFIGELHRCTKISLLRILGTPVHFTDE